MAFNPGGGGISAATDVALSAPSNAQLLGYDASIGKWKNFPRSAQLTENVFIQASGGSSETIPDMTTATITSIRLDAANCVLTFPTAGSGKSFLLTLIQDASGNRTVTWPSGVKWQGGVVPTLTKTPQKQDVFSFMSIDGTSWLGFMAGANF